VSLERAAEGSATVTLARRLRDRLESAFSPLTRRLAAVDRRLVKVVRGSRLHGWLTADPDPEPIVIDLRETYTVGPVLAVLDRLAAGTADSRFADATQDVANRLTEAPARALGIVLCLGFAVSLLGTVVEGGLTWSVYVFHGLGLLVGLLALRDHRDAESLAESPVWGAVTAVFAPPPPDEP
jgi:hypothetical protein